MAFGIDYSYGSGLTAAAMKAAGVTFACRYLSPEPNSKNISKAEFDNLTKAGLTVVLVWESTGHESGAPAGASGAREADRQATALGAVGIPLYFAPADYDVPVTDQAGINAYLDGAASVIGRGRTGLYGGYWPVKRAFDAGKCHYGWQTYAWSGNNLDPRAHIYQYRNGAHLGPADVDYDRSLKPDYGGWPRPAVTHPPPSSGAPAPVPPVPVTKGPSMSMVYLPDADNAPLALGREVARLRFVGITAETIKVDFLGVPDPSVTLPIGYTVADAQAGGVGVNPDCLAVRVKRDTAGVLPPGQPRPPVAVWFITA